MTAIETLMKRLLLLAQPRLGSIPGAFEELSHEVQGTRSHPKIFENWHIALLNVQVRHHVAASIGGVAAYDDDLLKLIDRWAVAYQDVDVPPLTPTTSATQVAAGLRHVSAAPEPITPVRAGYARRADVQPARWQVWRLIPDCQLWQGVCLSLDIEPAGKLADEVARGRSDYSSMPPDFWDRMMVCQANVRMSGPICPLEVGMGWANSPRIRVRLSDVAAFLASAQFTMPDAMRALLPSGLKVESVADDVRSAGELATAGPVDVEQTEAAGDCAEPLDTPTMARVLDGVGGKMADKWKKTLGDPPKWMREARVSAGAQGKLPATWNPVLLFGLLLRDERATKHEAGRLFRSRAELAPWAGVWRERESCATWYFDR